MTFSFTYAKSGFLEQAVYRFYTVIYKNETKKKKKENEEGNNRKVLILRSKKHLNT